MASEHDFDGVMSEQEQENHLAKLVLEERKAQKKLACLTSKARQTAGILHVVMDALNLVDAFARPQHLVATGVKCIPHSVYLRAGFS